MDVLFRVNLVLPEVSCTEILSFSPTKPIVLSTKSEKSDFIAAAFVVWVSLFFHTMISSFIVQKLNSHNSLSIALTLLKYHWINPVIIHRIGRCTSRALHKPGSLRVSEISQCLPRIYFLIPSYHRLHLNIPDRINTGKQQTICMKQPDTIQESRSSPTQTVNGTQILPFSVVQLTKKKLL